MTFQDPSNNRKAMISGLYGFSSEWKEGGRKVEPYTEPESET